MEGCNYCVMKNRRSIKDGIKTGLLEAGRGCCRTPTYPLVKLWTEFNFSGEIKTKLLNILGVVSVETPPPTSYSSFTLESQVIDLWTQDEEI